jgi:hypothetical protein
MKLRAVALGVLLLGGVCGTANAADSCPHVLSVKTLIAEAKKHHGRKVCVAGILHIEFEGNALIWGRQHVWLDFFRGPPWTEDGIARDERRMNDWKRRYQGRCVVVRGTYDVTCRVPDEWLLGGRHAILVGREVLRGLLADLNSRGTTC